MLFGFASFSNTGEPKCNLVERYSIIYSSGVHIYMNGLSCHMRPGWCLGPCCQQWAISVSIILLQQGTVSISVSCVPNKGLPVLQPESTGLAATRGHTDVSGLHCHSRPRGYPWSRVPIRAWPVSIVWLWLGALIMATIKIILTCVPGTLSVGDCIFCQIRKINIHSSFHFTLPCTNLVTHR